jgi:hypothetical protein
MAARGVSTPAGAVAAWALSDEGDDPGLTDRVGPPVNEREATAESDKQREGGDGRIGQAEQAGCENFQGNDLGYQGGSGRIDNGLWQILFKIFKTKIWVLKSRISNFKPKLNWGQTRINSNKLFEYFSNLHFLKIC